MFHPASYQIAIHLFPRLIGLIYLFLFFPFLFQIRGLLGEQGILPIKRYLQNASYLGKRRFYWIPTLFWLFSSDRALLATLAIALLLSLALILGGPPLVLLPLLYLLHLSIVSGGQDFLSFGWEMFFIEIVCNAFFLSMGPNLFVWMSINLLLFRFNFQAGISKLLSGDRNWRSLTALKFHYQSQPLPNTQAWYFEKLPLWFHKLSTLFMFFAELVAPFAIFGGERMRLIAFIFLGGLQLIIWFTGNFSYLNHMTLCFCTLLLGDSYLFAAPAQEPSSSLLLSSVGALLIALQLISLWNYFLPNRRLQTILGWLSPFHLINRYGIFAVMTTRRDEIVVEGSEDGVHWEEYLFRYKPSEVGRRPRRISPYQPRLDWQAWFLPFSDFSSRVWFQNFLLRLLQGSPPVLKLLRHNPFPEKPPKYIRALVYEYEFSDAKTKRESGAWWSRRLLGAYSTVFSLKD